MSQQDTTVASEEDEFETDDSEDSVPQTKPWNPADIRVTTKTWSLKQAIEDINDGSIDIVPDFQRDYIWGKKQQTLLIESILLGIPMPAFYFNADKQGVLQVVDGVQRLSTIRNFAKMPTMEEDNKGGFSLSEDLEYLKELVGKQFHQLDAPLRRRFNQTQIVVHVIDATSPMDLKYDIFKRINTGGTPLNPQEIRHCMSKQRSRNFLKKLALSDEFREVVAIKPKRMEDQEMVLRFVAFRQLMVSDSTFGNYPKDQTLGGFLLTAAMDLDDTDKVPEKILRDIESDFRRALLNASKVFGQQVFRKVMKGAKQRARMSRPLFEIWTVALTQILELTDDLGERIRVKAGDAMTHDLDFIDSYTRGTGKPERIRLRFTKALDIVRKAMEEGQ
jgi:hypothetical protein